MTTANASSYYSMTRELQSYLEASGIEWPAFKNYIPCMVHCIQLALGAFISSLGVTGGTTSWEAHWHNPQLDENETIAIGYSQHLEKRGMQE